MVAECAIGACAMIEEFKQEQSIEYSLTSIAISLKRIADALQKPEVQVPKYIKPELFLNKR